MMRTLRHAIVCLCVLAHAAIAQRTPELAPHGASLSSIIRVVGVSPSPEALGVPRDADVVVEFDRPVDPASLTPSSFHVLGRWSGPVAGQFVLLDPRTVAFVRSRDFSAAERVIVSLSTDIRAIDGTALARGRTFAFWARTDPSPLAFTHTATLVPGDVPYGAHGGDLDDDGDLDLAIPNEDSSNVSVFLNNGNDTYAARADYSVGFHCSPSEGLDLSGDAIVDLAVANILDNSVSILIGNGDGTFRPQVLYAVGSQPRGLAALDIDSDGDADLVTANRQSSNLSILRNRGDGTFEPATTKDAGISGETGVAAADMNGDLVTDLVVIGWGNSRIATLLGDGRGGFTFHSSQPTSSRPWMLNLGDLNADGHVDAAVAASGAGRAGIFLGTGQGGLGGETSFDSGEFPIAIDLGDLDGDHDLDMVTSSYSSGDFHVYTNDGAGLFTMRFTLDALTAGSCAVLHDRDNDGDTDLTLIDELADRILLYTQQ